MTQRLGQYYHTSEAKKQPRAISIHSRAIYDELVELSRHIDFSLPIFMGKSKRNHSVGSVQSLIVEIALTNQSFREYLRRFMVRGGEAWAGVIDHRDMYEDSFSHMLKFPEKQSEPQRAVPKPSKPLTYQPGKYYEQVVLPRQRGEI